MILFNTIVDLVIEYGLGLLTLSKAQHDRLEVIQYKGTKANILEWTNDTSAEAMRHILYLPKVAGRHKLAKVSAYLKVAADTKRPFNE